LRKLRFLRYCVKLPPALRAAGLNTAFVDRRRTWKHDQL